jgi:hypothetical protein
MIAVWYDRTNQRVTPARWTAGGRNQKGRIPCSHCSNPQAERPSGGLQGNLFQTD